MDTVLQIVVVREFASTQWVLHLVKQGIIQWTWWMWLDNETEGCQCVCCLSLCHCWILWWRCVTLCAATDLLTTTTCRVVSVSSWILSQWLVCWIHQEVTRLMATVYWPQWRVCGMCWSVIVWLYHLSVFISSESQSFLNDPLNMWLNCGVLGQWC
jgi:hypothetical protein